MFYLLFMRSYPHECEHFQFRFTDLFITIYLSIIYFFNSFLRTEIIARVAAREMPPFRPAVGRTDCPEDRSINFVQFMVSIK